MIAVDTNVLIYACDQADQRRQKIALDLVTSSTDGVLLWQVACEFLSASGKLSKQGFTPTDAWNRLNEFQDLLPLVLPTDANLVRAKALHLTGGGVTLGCPHPVGVCRSWRRDLLLRGPARLRRFRRSPDRRSVQVEGPRRGTQGQGAVGPLRAKALVPGSPPTPAGLRSPSRRNPLNETMLLADSAATGGGLCRPLSAPADVSQQIWA